MLRHSIPDVKRAGASLLATNKQKPALRRLSVVYLLRGPESNRRLGVMSPPRYLSSTPLVFMLRVRESKRNSNEMKFAKYLLKAADGAACLLGRKRVARARVRDFISHFVRFPRVVERRKIRAINLLQLFSD